MIAAALTTLALFASAAPPDTSTLQHAAPSPLRAVAAAGPSVADRQGHGPVAGLGLGTGFELGTNPYLRVAFRLDVHAFRAGGLTSHTTTGLLLFKVHLRPAGWRAWPFLYAGVGYGTAPNYSDFVLPAAAAAGFGVQCRLPGGQEIFLEAGTLGANETHFIPIRLGTLLP
ncbi:MAG: hypothetical protein HZC42_10465 [Candidatus Eisenbacteria bacterium]|nr:hypothetical protein [Candidatus Eisenbacteria bacterium]